MLSILINIYCFITLLVVCVSYYISHQYELSDAYIDRILGFNVFLVLLASVILLYQLVRWIFKRKISKALKIYLSSIPFVTIILLCIDSIYKHNYTYQYYIGLINSLFCVYVGIGLIWLHQSLLKKKHHNDE